MKTRICPLCGKPVFPIESAAFTYYTTGSTTTTIDCAGTFGFSGTTDYYCPGHPLATTTSTTTVIAGFWGTETTAKRGYLAPGREGVPDAFYAAFEGEENEW